MPLYAPSDFFSFLRIYERNNSYLSLMTNTIKFKKTCLISTMLVFGIILLSTILWTNVEFSSASYTSSQLKNGIPISTKNKICYVSPTDRRKLNRVYNNTDIKMIYFITPTYPRPEQVPELTRLAHTLMHVPRLHWIVADDVSSCSEEVLNILRRTGVPFTHLSSPKPFVYKTKSGVPRGVANRLASLDWIKKNVREGILYFGDDDNTFDLRLFEEIRNTKKVSMFPVGLIGEYGVSSPVVKDGKVVAFFDSWPGARMFPVDMAGFAVNVAFLNPAATMPYTAGIEEDGFLISLGLKIEDIEPLADNCSKVFVWHTRTSAAKKTTIRLNFEEAGKFSEYGSFLDLLRQVKSLGMANLSHNAGKMLHFTRNKKTSNTIPAVMVEN